MKKKFPRLGQHFLTSPAIAHAVAEAGHIAPHETVLEIGPGRGMLTRELLACGAHVIAIEKDETLARFLEKEFARELKEESLKLKITDVRDLLSTFHFPLSTPYKVISNIPYYITGELLRMFLTTTHQPTTIVFLVQKEVAERIARSKKESLLSLSVKAYGTPRYVRTVKAGSFSPPPSVDSAILAIENISRKNFTDASEERFFELLHAGFGQKRKTLIGNLHRSISDLRGHSWELTWEYLKLDPKVRAEDVPLPTWLQLARRP